MNQQRFQPYIVPTIVGALVALHLMLDALLACAAQIAEWKMTYPGSAFVFLGVAGFYFGQGNLIATWAAFAPGRLLVRIPWAILLSVLVWYGLVIGVRLSMSIDASLYTWPGAYSYRGMDIDRPLALFFGGLILLGVAVAQVPLWIASRSFGWRMLTPASQGNSVVDERQFNISHLLGGMVAVSIALALGRMVLPNRGGWNPSDYFNEGYVLLIVAVLGNLIVAAPCIWLAFVPTGQIRTAAFGWAVLIMAASAVEIILLSASLGSPGPELGEVWLQVVTFNTTQCLTIVVTLAILRSIGFRLIRQRSESPDT